MDPPTQLIDDEIQAFADRVLIDKGMDFDLLRRKLRSLDTVEETEDRYFDFAGVSNSDLKLLSKHPQHFLDEKIREIEEEEEEKDYYTLGNMIETRLLFPDEFDDLFVREPEEMKSPSSGKQKAIVQHILDGDDPETAFRKEYSTKRKSDEKIAEQAQNKYDNLSTFIEHQEDINNSGKTPYSSDQMDTVNKAMLAVKQNERAMELLNPSSGQFKTQVPLVGSMDAIGETVLMKGLADWLVVSEGRIINIDLKTTSRGLQSFDYYYQKYRYYRQQAIYRHLLLQEVDRPVDTKCVVVTTDPPYGCRVLDVSDTLLEVGERETKALLKRLVMHLTEHSFEGFLEDLLPGRLSVSKDGDLLERHLEQARITSNGRS
jgi:hypothetical protein